MLRNVLMAAPLVGTLAIIGPGSTQQSHAAQMTPYTAPYTATSGSPLLQLVQERIEPRSGGGGNRGSAGRGGSDRSMGRSGGENRSYRSGRSSSRNADRSREYRRDRGDRNRSARSRDRDRNDYRRDRDRRYSDRGDRRHRHHRGTRHVWAPGIVFYFDDGYYYGDCDWLYARALATDSPTWWRRYELCREWS